MEKPHWKNLNASLECPSCGNKEGHKKRWDYALSRGRYEYKCDCGYVWHYSRTGLAIKD